MAERYLKYAARVRLAVVPLARLLRQQADSSLTPTQLSAMGSIHRHGPLTLGDLASHERLSLPTISKVVTALEASGLVERGSDHRDRRVCLVRLSAAGTTWIADRRGQIDAWLATRLADLPVAETEALAAAVPVLERLIAREP